MKIRIVTQQDIDQLTHLKKPQKEHHVKMFHENQLTRLREMSEGKALYLVTEDNHKIIAHLLIKLNGISTEPNFPNMNDLYVLEEERNKGIGTTLIHEAEKLTKERGFSKISISVNPTLNPKAKQLYERLGYHQTNTKPYLDGVYDGNEDWVVDMVKKFNN